MFVVFVCFLCVFTMYVNVLTVLSVSASFYDESIFFAFSGENMFFIIIPTQRNLYLELNLNQPLMLILVEPHRGSQRSGHYKIILA